MAWAFSSTYGEQLDQLSAEASQMARIVAAHFDTQADSVEPAELLAYLNAVAPQDGYITVEDDSGAVFLQSDPAQDAIETHAGRTQAPGTGWTVEVGLPTSIAWDRTSPVYGRTIAISGIATLILLVIQAGFGRRWLRSFQKLEHHAIRVGSGDYTMPAAEKMPSRELERMRDTFTTMVGRLAEAYADIARQVEEERRMRLEVESLQQQVIRQERLAAIGVLLSGIAHELNNPLQAISGFAQLLQRDPNISSDVRTDLALIQKESARASAIIRNLSRFSRQQGSQPVRVYLRDVVASVVELRQRRLQEQGIVLEIEDEAVEPVLGVLTELQQVVLNFVINAEHALAATETGEPRIVIRTMDIPRGVRLEVEDTGPGVPPEDESKLFQPFFTTKPIGEGTGLGLSVSYGIIEAFHGTIGYRRGKNGGAEFFFELPNADAAQEAAKA
jgi:C4-dicarboxylate-specific signal transduction histidine kinase